MQVDFSKLHLPQPFTEKYVLALAEHQQEGNELPEFLFVAIQTQGVLKYAPLELPFIRCAGGVWVDLEGFIQDFEAYKSDPESTEEAWHYTVSGNINTQGYYPEGYALHATGIWK